MNKRWRTQRMARAMPRTGWGNGPGSALVLLAAVAACQVAAWSWPIVVSGRCGETRDFAGLMDLWVDGSGYVQVTSLEQWSDKRAVILDVLFDFLLPHPDELQPLDLTVVSEEDMGGYVRKTIEYSTLPGERVRAYLLVPVEARLPAPAILALHQTTCCGKSEVVGLGCDKSLAYGLDLVHRGYVVLAPDGITMGERIGDGICGDTGQLYKKFPHWSALGIMTWEAIQAINVLVSLPEVDPARIGCIGHSHGGYGTILLASIDERVRASVSSCGFMGMCDDVQPTRWARPSGFVFMPGLRPYIKKRVFPFDFHELLALIAPRPFMNISAENDVIFPGSTQSSVRAVEEVRQVYQRIYGDEGLIQNMIHRFGHEFPPQAKQAAYQWLDSWLKRGAEAPAGSPDELAAQAGKALLPAARLRVDGSWRGSFSVAMGTRSRLTLSIYDVTGRKVSEVANGEFGPGTQEFFWDCKAGDGTPVQPGVYFYRLETSDGVRSGKTLVMR